MWIEISNTVLKQLRLIRCFKIISVSELSPLMQIKYGMQNNSRFGFTIWKK
jgi:hypothetical protein